MSGVSATLSARASRCALRRSSTTSRHSYPVDNRGEKVDLTMMYVGTKALFERAGFTQASETDSVLDGFPRVLMRLDLR